jgi:S-adenosylmethionine-diacylglycerol 3-amino-3-carboxypropyl transferase
MALPNLVALFGEEATQNAVKPFSEHFSQQTLMILKHANLPASKNPYVHQMLLGAFKQNIYYPWITQDAPNNLPEIRYSHSSMLEILQNSSECYQFIHLSNILDWLNKKQASDLLQSAYSRLTKGGCLFIRQLNSHLNIPQLCEYLEWDDGYAGKLLSEDRSFFYPKLHVGVKT